MRFSTSRIPVWLKNKYFLATAVFVFILLFFDRNDLFVQWDRNRQLNQLTQSKGYYEGAIRTQKAELQQLKADPATLERYAREKYLMKKDNEDLFLIREEN